MKLKKIHKNEQDEPWPSSKPILCIGGANLDRKIMIKGTFQLHTSNPSSTRLQSCGGVARNVAENLGRLSQRVSLLTAVGDDAEGEFIIEQSSRYMHVVPLQVKGEPSTGVYTALLNERGELIVATAEMEIYDQIRPSVIFENAPLIASSRLVLLDTNFSMNVIAATIHVCHEHRVPIVVSSVSASKMRKLPRNLHGVEWLVCKPVEAEAYLGLEFTDDQHMLDATRIFHKLGVQNVIFICGADRVLYASQDGTHGQIPMHPVQEVIDVTGADDAFIAGMIYGITQGYPMEQVCQFGISCVDLTLQTDRTVSETLSMNKLHSRFQELYGTHSQNFVFFKGVYFKKKDT
ncbi:carbohydrate kinase family protein [Paenibacillus polymyxa]|uniref:carbohydrate kinase family protein n=1 Tax=Paenibacillus polymyxa TaxID=1406 RepID=UPI00083D4B5D|nr:carbohydrate kinase family protein [Paenibacillus polymyxa]ODB61912.1 ribokinase [Paenibacillus polymyxa]